MGAAMAKARQRAKSRKDKERQLHPGQPIKIHTKQLTTRILQQLAIYIFFIGFYLGAYFLSEGASADVYFVGHRIKQLFIEQEFPPESSHVHKSLMDIKTVNELEQWLVGPFISSVYDVDAAGYGGASAFAGRNVTSSRNVMVGAIRIGQVRKKFAPACPSMVGLRPLDPARSNTTCLVASTLSARGYSGPDKERLSPVEDMSPFGGGSSNRLFSFNGSAGTIDEDIVGRRRFIGSSVTTYYGNIYPVAGFPVLLPNTNSYEARLRPGLALEPFVEAQRTAMRDLLDVDGYIDRQTVAVTVEVSYYNPPLRQICALRFVFELSESGGVMPSYFWYTSKFFRFVYANATFNTPQQVGRVILEFIVASFYLFFICEELYYVRKHGLWKTFNLASSIHRLNIICYLFVWLFRIWGTGLVAPSYPPSADAYYDFILPSNRLYFARNFQSANAFLIFFKLVTYLGHIPRFALLNNTLAATTQSLISFFLIFLVIIVGFTQSFIYFFGKDIFEYRLLNKAFTTMFTSLLGSYMFRLGRGGGLAGGIDQLLSLQPLYTVVLFFVVIFFGVFVCFNILIALVGDAYTVAKATIEDEKDVTASGIDTAFDSLMRRSSWACCFRSCLGKDPATARRRVQAIAKYFGGHGNAPAAIDGKMKVVVHHLPGGQTKTVVEERNHEAEDDRRGDAVAALGSEGGPNRGAAGANAPGADVTSEAIAPGGAVDGSSSPSRSRRSSIDDDDIIFDDKGRVVKETHSQRRWRQQRRDRIASIDGTIARLEALIVSSRTLVGHAGLLGPARIGSSMTERVRDVSTGRVQGTGEGWDATKFAVSEAAMHKLQVWAKETELAHVVDDLEGEHDRRLKGIEYERSREFGPRVWGELGKGVRAKFRATARAVEFADLLIKKEAARIEARTKTVDEMRHAQEYRRDGTMLPVVKASNDSVLLITKESLREWHVEPSIVGIGTVLADIDIKSIEEVGEDGGRFRVELARNEKRSRAIRAMAIRRHAAALELAASPLLSRVEAVRGRGGEMMATMKVEEVKGPISSSSSSSSGTSTATNDGSSLSPSAVLPVSSPSTLLPYTTTTTTTTKQWPTVQDRVDARLGLERQCTLRMTLAGAQEAEALAGVDLDTLLQGGETRHEQLGLLYSKVLPVDETVVLRFRSPNYRALAKTLLLSIGVPETAFAQDEEIITKRKVDALLLRARAEDMAMRCTEEWRSSEAERLAMEAMEARRREEEEARARRKPTVSDILLPTKGRTRKDIEAI
eukprot:g4034.t1